MTTNSMPVALLALKGVNKHVALVRCGHMQVNLSLQREAPLCPERGNPADYGS